MKTRSLIGLVVALLAVMAITIFVGSSAGATGHPTYPHPDCEDHLYGNEYCDTTTTVAPSTTVPETTEVTTTTLPETTTVPTTVPETPSTTLPGTYIGDFAYIERTPPVEIGTAATTVKPAEPSKIAFTG